MAASAPELVEQVVALRKVRSAIGSRTEQRRLSKVIRQLRCQLGAGVPKRQAAAALGVTVQSLDRWIAAGRIPVIRRPGSSRELVDAETLLLLAEEVEQLREQGHVRVLARAVASLAERRPPPRRLAPNQRARELRSEYLASTAAGRMRQGIELSHVGTRLAAHGRARIKAARHED